MRTKTEIIAETPTMYRPIIEVLIDIRDTLIEEGRAVHEERQRQGMPSERACESCRGKGCFYCNKTGRSA